MPQHAAPGGFSGLAVANVTLNPLPCLTAPTTHCAQERTTRVVVLRSLVPGVFSAGADLKERATMTQVLGWACH